MSNYLIVTPQGEDYLRPSEVFQNLTYNTKDLTIDDDMAATEAFVALDGTGLAYLQGQITVDTASVSANMTLCTLPTGIVPQRDTYQPVAVLRSGAYVANAVKVDESDANVVLLTQPQQNDIVCLDSISFLVDTYNN
jgi:hypothetical protein